MTISKAWIDEQIQKCREDLQKTDDPLKRNEILGREFAFTKAYAELTKAPVPKSVQEMLEKKKDFDKDKTYEDILRYYIDKKGYTKEHANAIAQKVVADQAQKRLQV